MKNRMMSVCVSAIFAAVVLLCIVSHTQAGNILVSGNSMDQSNTNLTGTIAGLGHTAVFVAPVNFAGTSLVGFDAVWLDGFSQYGAGAWPANLLAFMDTGGNVLVQNPGFGSEALSMYPLGAQLTATFTFPPGEDTIAIVDALSPLGANHAVHAGLTDAGLSHWGPSAFGSFSNLGAFSGLTNTGTAGQWVTIVTRVGSGYLVYTQQGVSQYLSSAANPGPSSEAARFLDNVVTLTRVAVSVVNAELAGRVKPGTSAINPTPVPDGPAGTFSFTAEFCNTSAESLTALVSVTNTLTGGNVLLNRDSGTPAAVGSERTFPANRGYTDGTLTPGECLDVSYEIGLATRQRFQFFVDVLGVATP